MDASRNTVKGLLRLVLTSLMVGGIGSTQTQAVQLEEFRSGENQIHLLELFSSEGCSSCPPADRWLAKLRERKDLWKQFVPVEFHVDYWNRLGWTDRLSKSVYTERQQNYAREWANSNVYTPGFVLNGEEVRPSGDELPWEGKIPNRIGVLSVKQIGRLKFQITFSSVKKLKSLRVFGALLGNGLESKVSSGENAGTLLKHEFVVLNLIQRQADISRNDYTAIIELTSPAKESAKSYSVAFWATSSESQKPLQAVGGDITP